MRLEHVVRTRWNQRAGACRPPKNHWLQPVRPTGRAERAALVDETVPMAALTRLRSLWARPQTNWLKVVRPSTSAAHPAGQRGDKQDRTGSPRNRAASHIPSKFRRRSLRLRRSKRAYRRELWARRYTIGARPCCAQSEAGPRRSTLPASTSCSTARRTVIGLPPDVFARSARVNSPVFLATIALTSSTRTRPSRSGCWPRLRLPGGVTLLCDGAFVKPAARIVA